jgi:hypothetical protein
MAKNNQQPARDVDIDVDPRPGVHWARTETTFNKAFRPATDAAREQESKNNPGKP